MIVLKPCVSKVRLDELSFSPDGITIAAPAGHQGVMLWTAFTSGAKAELLKPPIVCKRLAFTPDGTTLITGNDSLCAFDLSSRKSVPYPIEPGHALWFGVSPDGKRLVVSQRHRTAEECRVTGWDVGDCREPAWSIDVSGLVCAPPLFPPKGDKFILCVHWQNEAPHWFSHRATHSSATGKELDASGTFMDLPELVALSPDGRTLACRTREIVYFYTAAGAWPTIPRVRNDSKQHFTGVAFHPSGKFLAATSNDKTVKLYDTATWQLAKTFTWDIGRMRSIAFSPDGTLAAAGGDKGKVVVWDVDM
jgi:WD40 repeat protein